MTVTLVLFAGKFLRTAERLTSCVEVSRATQSKDLVAI